MVVCVACALCFCVCVCLYVMSKGGAHRCWVCHCCLLLLQYTQTVRCVQQCVGVCCVSVVHALCMMCACCVCNHMTLTSAASACSSERALEATGAEAASPAAASLASLAAARANSCVKNCGVGKKPRGRLSVCGRVYVRMFGKEGVSG